MTDPLRPAGRTVHPTGADGTVRDWLTAPARGTPVTDLDRFLRADGDPWQGGRWVLTNGPDVGPLKERLAQAHPIPADQHLAPPVEHGPLAWEVDGTTHHDTWQRVRTEPDGLLDWSVFCFTPEYRHALAATVLETDQAEWRELEVHTTGPFVLWLDGEPVRSGTRVSYMEPEVHRVRVRLPSRTTAVHLATWQVAFRECRHIARLRVVGLPVRVVVPSPGADEAAARLAETLLESVGSPSWGQVGDDAVLTAPPGVALQARVAGATGWRSVRVDEHGRVQVPLRREPDPASTGATMLASGESVVEVKVDDERCPQVRRIPVAALPPLVRTTPAGGPAAWRQELLRHAAGGGGAPPASPGVAGVLARCALHPEAVVERAHLAHALGLVRRRGDCADFELLALLHVWHGVPADRWEAGLREEVAQVLAGMKYWIDQPGLDAMCYFTENHQLVWHVAQHVAGQTLPEHTFTVDGRPGARHADEGRDRAAAWIARKLRGGFSEFDSNAYLAIDTLALTTLIELSDDERLVRAARVLLDKTLLTLATNSWRGIHGAAHGRSYVRTLRSARFESTSALLRLIAGVGTLNEDLLPATVLALAGRYAIPGVVRGLAGSEPEEWWGRQVYRGELAFSRDLLDRPYRSDVRVWRTPDVMLSSVQDYRSGLPGLQEHVWGATLGPELQVFVTHPASSDTTNAGRPNAWAGHRVLPRVHQHREALVHLQRFTSTDPVRATHLWLPVHQADDVAQSGDWIAVRRGKGYVAVATPGGVRPVLTGETAMQAWEPPAGGSAWVAVVGRDAADGSFATWFESLQAAELTWHPRGEADPGVVLARAGAPRLECTADTPFLVDGQPAGLGRDGRPEHEPHLDNPAVHLPFGADAAEVRWGGHTHRLDIGTALRGLDGLLSG